MKTTHTNAKKNSIEWEINYERVNKNDKTHFSNEGQNEFKTLFDGSSIHIGSILNTFVNVFKTNSGAQHPSLIKMISFAVIIYFVGNFFLMNSANPNSDPNMKIRYASMTQTITAQNNEVKETKTIQETKQAPFQTAAPVSVRKIKPNYVTRYIDRYKKVAQAEMKKYGIPASISMAQAIIESKAGNSSLSNKNNNHFGMKCFSKSCSKGHCTNHGDDSHKDFFRKYNSPWESWRAHSKLLTNNRYKSLQAHKTDFKKWAKGLQEKGYATDKSYSKKLIEVIKKYDLNKLDIV